MQYMYIYGWDRPKKLKKIQLLIYLLHVCTCNSWKKPYRILGTNLVSTNLFFKKPYIYISYNLFPSLQNVTYYSYRGRFSETTKLVTIHKGGVGPRGKQTWHKELLSIPTTPPSHLHGCKIIDIQYCIEVGQL